MIVKLAGTNGSGKSSLVRALMNVWAFEPYFEPGRKRPLGYEAAVKKSERLARYFDRVVVLGPYDTPCGGMDAVGEHELRCRLVQDQTGLPRSLCLFESVLDGTTYGRLGALSDADPESWLYAFLDTPYEVCVARVEARRRARGNLAPFDGERSLRPKIRACASVAKRAATAGHAVVWIDHRQTPARGAAALIEAIEKVAKG